MLMSDDQRTWKKTKAQNNNLDFILQYIQFYLGEFDRVRLKNINKGSHKEPVWYNQQRINGWQGIDNLSTAFY